MTDYLVGDVVDVNGQHAVVRFVGLTDFQEGDWIGVELLDMPTGKNNGTVQGVQYFSCRDRYGMFVRPVVPRLIDRPKPKTRQQQTRPDSQQRLNAPSPVSIKPRSMTLRVGTPLLFLPCDCAARGLMIEGVYMI